MKTSEAINEISAALAKVQGEVSNPVFNKTNPHFKSSYADLSSVLNAVRPPLSKNGISFMQLTNLEDSGLVLYTRLVHSSGQWIESVYPVTASGKHQEIAAALTYAKRLSLSAIVGVSGEDDDDGNAANTVPVVAKGTPRVKPEASQLGIPESVLKMEEILLDLDKCASKEDLQKWATTNSQTKQTLADAHQKQITQAFQAAQERIRDILVKAV